MGRYQQYKGNSENKLFYIVDNLIGGVNTDYSDDAMNDNEFKSIINFNVDKKGSLVKRLGFGKLDALSQIFNMYDKLPEVKGKEDDNTHPEETNDNIVYAKLLRNDNGCFRNLSAFTGDKAYRKYQRLYGSQENIFNLLIITTNFNENKSKAWRFGCKLPSLSYDDNGVEKEDETIVVESEITELPVLFDWNNNLCNIDTIEYFDKIFFTSNDKGLVEYLSDYGVFGYATPLVKDNSFLYKPTPMEIRKVGFNVLAAEPMTWVDYSGLSTDSIQGVYLTFDYDVPLMYIPSGREFELNVLYTGEDTGFDITFTEGETTRDATITLDEDKSTGGLKVYKVNFVTQPTSNTEIKIVKKDSNISAYYDYYDVQNLEYDEDDVVRYLNVGKYKIVEMYNRAVYYKDDTMWFSEINNFGYVPNYNYVSLPLEPTDEITKIVFFKNVYIIFTKQRIYKMLNSFGDDDFEIMPLNMSLGCNAPNTIIPIENVLYFASPRGLYELVSSNTYSSSSLTFENVKELDTKVKNLTSDVTMYLNEISNPAVRYNGISDNAYALRYKDKYILFFNTSYEKGDIAALKNIDALVYQYDIRAFSEIRFPIKPSFMFRVDGAIETFATVPQKEEYTSEETLLDYDFANNGIPSDITTKGTVITNPGVGLNLNGYIQTNEFNKDIVSNGFDAEIKCKINSGTGKLLDYRQQTPVSASTKETITIQSEYSHGYAAKIVCDVIPDVDSGTAAVSYKFYWLRENTSINKSYNGTYKLVDGNGNTLVTATAFNFDFGSDLIVQSGTGTFNIEYDNKNYSKDWILSASSKYPVYTNTTGWNNGDNVSIYHNDKMYTTSSGGSSFSWLSMTVSGTAVASNGTCNVSLGCAIVNTSDLYVGSRECIVYVDGNALYYTIPSISGKGTHWNNGGQQTISFSYNGNKNVTISGRYYVNATLSGTKRTYIYMHGYSQYLPSTTSYTTTSTNWYDFTISKTSNVTLNKLANASYRYITLSLDEDEHKINIGIDNEDYIYSNSITNDDISTLGEGDWKISLVNNTDNYRLSITKDDTLFGYIDILPKYIYNGNRDNSVILKDIDCAVYYYQLVCGSDTVTQYKIDEGSGDKLTNFGTSEYGTINGTYTWIVDKGIKLNGSGYLSLDEITNVSFTNGFSIEVECDVENSNCKIFDFATGYDTGVNDLQKQSINLGIKDENLVLSTVSTDKRSIKLGYKIPSGRHKWKYALTDNGSGYTGTIYLDDELVYTNKYNYGTITNNRRLSNFIGKSNNVDDNLFEGMLYNLKITINKSSSLVKIYEGAMYEYDTTFDDFGQPMEIELETKGINMNYPMHQKKLKNLFIKGLGGYKYSEFFLEVYADGYLVNDPKTYNAYVDKATGEITYDYTETKALNFDEQQSLLGNIRLDGTKLGSKEYENRKIVIPSTKCKNVVIKIYGESDDYLSIDSIGYLFKLGKVKGDK